MQEYREFLENIIRLAEQANSTNDNIEIESRKDSFFTVNLKNSNPYHPNPIAEKMSFYDAEYFAAVSPKIMKEFCEKMIKILDSVE